MIAAALLAVLALGSVPVCQCQSSEACLAGPPEFLEENQFVCVLAKASSSSDATLLCFDSLEKMRNNEQVKAVADKKPCYLTYKKSSKELIKLDLSARLLETAGLSSTTKVQLDKSVSLLVGASRVLSLEGWAIASVNPEIFSNIGDAQKQKLKALALKNTSLQSLDASVLQPLSIEQLILVQNSKLSKFTNLQNVQLPSINNLHLVQFNISILNCNNFKSLPSGIEKLILMNESDKMPTGEAGCAFCSLPSNISEIIVREDVSRLPFFPDLTPKAGRRPPYPIGFTNLDGLSMPSIVYNTFNVTRFPPVGCDKCQHCSPWQPERKVDSGQGVQQQGTVKASDGGGGGNGVVRMSASLPATLATASLATLAAAAVTSAAPIGSV